MPAGFVVDVDDEFTHDHSVGKGNDSPVIFEFTVYDEPGYQTFIFITGRGDIPMSVRAMKAGAIEFLTKPFRDEDLLNAVEQAINRGRQIEQLKKMPAEQKAHSKDRLPSEISFSEIVGQSGALGRVLKEVETVAPTDSTVLIHGETGTGKELVARAIHNLSLRRSNPFVRIPAESMNALSEYPWPGNVRELENVIERAVILSSGSDLELPLAELAQRKALPAAVSTDYSTTLRQVEREHILRALKEARWVVGGPQGAAARLGMKRTTLGSLVKRLGITRPS